ncbi:hypothetical protein PIB30_025939 [Stylosanthes scabra]|uniref:NAC domain-containing protein n=1 Tax=Stylosanthes scabra TaxID=79078 RepID=A0ABU6Q9S9_9FABA|nr:hypothetical protein [Stylosanthes scabra]
MTQCNNNNYPENNHSTIVERNKDTLITRTCPSCGHHIKYQQGHQGAGIHDLPGLPAGVKFDPTDQEILEHLEAKVRSDIHKLHPLIDEFIPTLEDENGICCTHPEKLPGPYQFNYFKQYHLGNNEEEKEGELVVSKVFYQTQPRQCAGSLLIKDSSFPAKLKDHQASVHHHHTVTNNNHKNNNGFVDYYNASFISFDQGEQQQHRSNNATLISHFPVHDAAPFIP